jgi:hypothetical protein
MILKVWHLTALGVATVLLALLVMPRQPVAALVALAGIGAAAFLLARTRGIQLNLEAQILSLLDAHDRERTLVAAERSTYLDRLRRLHQVIAGQHRALGDLVREVEHMTDEPRHLMGAGASPSVADGIDWQADNARPRENEVVGSSKAWLRDVPVVAVDQELTPS